MKKMKTYALPILIFSFSFLLGCQGSGMADLTENDAHKIMSGPGLSTEPRVVDHFFGLTEPRDAYVRFSYGTLTFRDAVGGGNDVNSWHAPGGVSVYAGGNDTSESFFIGAFPFNFVHPSSGQDLLVYRQPGESEFKSAIFGQEVEFQWLDITKNFYIPEPIYCLAPVPMGMMETPGIPVDVSRNLEFRWNQDPQNAKGVIISFRRGGNRNFGPLFYYEVFEDNGVAEIPYSVLAEFGVGSDIHVSLARGNHLQETYGDENKLLTVLGFTSVDTYITLVESQK